MAGEGLVDRLAQLPAMAPIPREELEWLAAHGTLSTFEAGAVLAPKGEPVEHLWILLSGTIAVRVDHGSGPRQVIEWHKGEVSGMLPYSRMKGPPGDNYAMEPVECLEVHVRYFPEMVYRCPQFTAYTVHLMLDRARSFNTAGLHDEKMVSLGRLAAGLAHELNNPASATVRGAKTLLEGLEEADAAARALGATRLTAPEFEAIAQLRARCRERFNAVLSPIDRSDRQDELEDWLDRHGVKPALADALGETAITTGDLDSLADMLDADNLDAALRWIATGCSQHALSTDIEQAATRIHDLVAAVKRFTYMDRLAGPELVDVATGLRDTIRVVNSKARSKNASITLDMDPDLPSVRVNGGELNQVWLNIIDNALDAIPESGHVRITARHELDRVVVSIIDDGPGIPPDVKPRIFDAFFTTKPVGDGTGLGLDIAQRLVRAHRGEITVDSRPGRTAFHINLIAADDESTPHKGSPPG